MSEKLVEAFKLLKSKVGVWRFSPGEWRTILEAEAELDGVAPKPEAYGAFPKDFPHAAKLLAGGVLSLTHLEQLSDDEIIEVDGIGPASLEDIRSALAERSWE